MSEEMRKAMLNNLAWEFYRMQGYVAAEDFDFSVSRHPTERLMYQMAEKAIDFFDERGLIDED